MRATSRLPSKPNLLRIWDEATLEINLSTLRGMDPTWTPERIEELVRRLESIEGVRLPGKRNWPRTPLAPLGDPRKRQEFVAIIEDVVAGLSLV